MTSLSLPAAAATLSLNPTLLAAGNVVVGQSSTLSGRITNSGPSSVTINSGTSNIPAFTVISPAFPITLSSGKSQTVTLKFTPRYYQQIFGTITFASNASNTSLALATSGTGVKSASQTTSGTGGKVVVSATSMNLGTAKVGTAVTLPETITNTGTSSVTVTSTNSTGAAFGRTNISLPLTLAPNQSVTFTIFFRPVASGVATGTVTVASNASNPQLVIPLTGTGTTGSTTTPSASTLTVTPTSANLGSVTVGANKTTTATLTATNASVTVSSATTTSSEFKLSGATFPLTIAAGRSAPLTVQFTPASSGAASGKLSFVSNASNSPAVLTLTGTGVVASAHHVTLAWNSSTTPVAGYNVYHGSKSGGPYTKVNSAVNSSNNYSDSAVTAGTTYYYVVTGVDATGMESKYSNEVKAAVPSP